MNEMIDLLCENIPFCGNEPESVAALNHRNVAETFLDEETYLAFGGPIQNRLPTPSTEAQHENSA